MDAKDFFSIPFEQQTNESLSDWYGYYMQDKEEYRKDYMEKHNRLVYIKDLKEGDIIEVCYPEGSFSWTNGLYNVVKIEGNTITIYEESTGKRCIGLLNPNFIIK